MSRNFLEKRVEKTKTNRDMVREYDKSRTSVVLMEIIISILLFMVVGSVCIQLFVQSYKMNTISEQNERAGVIVSSMADQLLLYHGDMDKVKSYYSDCVDAYDTLAIYYDGAYRVCNFTSYAYILEVTVDDMDAELRNFHINMYGKDKEPIYSMELKVLTNDN